MLILASSKMGQDPASLGKNFGNPG